MCRGALDPPRQIERVPINPHRDEDMRKRTNPTKPTAAARKPRWRSGAGVPEYLADITPDETNPPRRVARESLRTRPARRGERLAVLHLGHLRFVVRPLAQAHRHAALVEIGRVLDDGRGVDGFSVGAGLLVVLRAVALRLVLRAEHAVGQV